MIEKKTVLVLGAGASMELGYPLGTQLRLDIIKELSATGTVLHRTLTESGNSSAQISSFHHALEGSGGSSVDQLLEHRPELTQVGKDSIAAIIGLREDPARLFQESWYSHLFRQLNAPFERFGANNLTIVTFNYDRSLDEFLFQAVLNKFGKTEEKTSAIVKNIPIIHVHGRLGLLPWKEGGGDRYRPFKLPVDIRGHSKSIKIIHEDNIDESEEFRYARKKLIKAEEIIFLGFGYDDTNLKRLFKGTELLPGCLATGSFIKLYPLEVDKIKTAFQKLTESRTRARGVPLLGAAEATTSSAIEFLRKEIRFT